jgi:uncharacterized coiled-coil DUF342 family protein
VQAAAWLNHKTAVNEEHMLTLVNYLWNTPQEIEVVKEIVESLCKNPISVELDEITSSAMESYEQFDEANDKQKAINKLRKELLRLYSKTQALTVKASENPAVISSIEQCVDKLEDFSRKSCEATGFTYVNLAELAKYKF